MAAIAAELTRDDVARLGGEWYERDIKPRLTAADHGKFVIIDVFSGDFEIGDTVVGILDPIHARRPGSRYWLERVGYPAPYEFAGGRPL